jgi:hypothetical protein
MYPRDFLDQENEEKVQNQGNKTASGSRIKKTRVGFVKHGSSSSVDISPSNKFTQMLK